MSKIKTPDSPVSIQDLVGALVEAIKLTKPIEKKTISTRKPASPWDPKDGSKKLKLKRRMYQHSLLMDQDFLTNDEVVLLNKLKTGLFLEGNVKVYRRKDQGIDIDYPVKTAAQRMRLASSFGIRNLSDLLQRCIDEANDPAKFAKPETEPDE